MTIPLRHLLCIQHIINGTATPEIYTLSLHGALPTSALRMTIVLWLPLQARIVRLYPGLLPRCAHRNDGENGDRHCEARSNEAIQRMPDGLPYSLMFGRCVSLIYERMLNIWFETSTYIIGNSFRKLIFKSEKRIKPKPKSESPFFAL